MPIQAVRIDSYMPVASQRGDLFELYIDLPLDEQ